jgi:hypothetical protein
VSNRGQTTIPHSSASRTWSPIGAWARLVLKTLLPFLSPVPPARCRGGPCLRRLGYRDRCHGFVLASEDHNEPNQARCCVVAGHRRGISLHAQSHVPESAAVPARVGACTCQTGWLYYSCLCSRSTSIGFKSRPRSARCHRSSVQSTPHIRGEFAGGCEA